MTEQLLKALLGKFIAQTPGINFCHVHKIAAIEGSKALAGVITKKEDSGVFHWLVETNWNVEEKGKFVIQNYTIIKEEEINDFEYTTGE